MDLKKKNEQLLTKSNSFCISCLIIGVFLILGVGGYFFFSGENDLAQVAEKQLKMISGGQLDAVYEESFSKDYKQKVSLEGFKHFVNDHSILKNNEEAVFYSLRQDEDHGEITGVIRDRQKGSVPLLFYFVKEDGRWKASDLQIFAYGVMRANGENDIADLEQQMNEPISPDLMVQMVETLEKNLKDLRENKIEEAYQKYTSEAFKEATSYAAYLDFLKQFPEFEKHTAVSFFEKGFVDGRGLIRATLIYQEGVYPVDFVMIKEGEKWKIWSLKARPTDVSSQVDESGKKKMISLVDQHLNLLKNGKIEDAYNNNHSDFKEETSFQDYREFVDNFPEVVDHEEVSYGEAKEQGPLATMPIVFKTQQGDSTFNFWFRHDHDDWKILGMQVKKSVSYPAAADHEKEKINIIIKDQLEALKEGDYSQAYYAFVAADFQKSTSLQSFKDFVGSYPILREFQKMEIHDVVKEGDLRLVKVTLISPKEHAEVDFRFAPEGKQWKVWGMQIMSAPVAAPPFHDDAALIKIVNDQISSIHQGDISKAYYAFTSPDFQENSSRDVFTSFVLGQSIYKDNTQVGAPKVEYKDNTAILLTELQSQQGEKKRVEYKFSYLSGRWKIDSIRIVEDLTPKEVVDKLKEKLMNFSKVLIGTETDSQGIVTKNNTIFQPTDKAITVNLAISQGLPGATIEMVLEHLDSGSKISPVKATLKKDGDSMVTFVFAPPQGGWPVGTYKLHTTSSTGLEANYSFVVIKPSEPPITPSANPTKPVSPTK